MSQTFEKHQDSQHYTRGQSIWWRRRNNPPEKALFVGYREKTVIIEIMLPNGDTRRKIARLEAIQPREEEYGREKASKEETDEAIMD